MVDQSIYTFVTKNSAFLITQIVIWLFSFGLIGSILFFGVWSDLHLHIEAVRSFLQGEANLPAHFLYFLLVAILGFGQANMYILSPAAGVLLATAIWAKYVGSAYMLRDYFNFNRGCIKSLFTQDYRIDKVPKGVNYQHPLNPKNLDNPVFPASLPNSLRWIIPAIILIFVFTLPGIEKHLGGQLPPNVWHNSTTIFLMPFSLGLFWFSFQFLAKKETRLLYPISLFLILNVLIKPSFVLCFAPIFSIFSFLKLGFSRKFFLSLLPLFFTGLLLIGEYAFLYTQTIPNTASDPSGIEIAFLKDWGRKSNFILFSLFASIAYPLLYLLLYWKKASKELLLQYAWVLFLMAIIILLFIVETGPRATHGNFRWQAVVCNYLLFLASTMSWTKHLNEQGFQFAVLKKKDWLLIIVLFGHLLSGIVYLVRIFIEKTTLI